MSPHSRLYLITPAQIALDRFPDLLAQALDGGDVACVQLRLKDTEESEIRRAAERLLPICHGRDVALVINDDPAIAAAVGADGVHVGADDADYARARAAVGDAAIVGVSCYDSRHRAIEAAEAGASYVAFGAFFPTQTKTPRARATTALLTWWSELIEVPCVAIGGITPANCAPLVEAGADFLAVISAVWDHPDGPAAGVRAFERAIASAGGA